MAYWIGKIETKAQFLGMKQQSCLLPSPATTAKVLFTTPIHLYDPQPEKTCHSSISPISQIWLIGQENLRP